MQRDSNFDPDSELLEDLLSSSGRRAVDELLPRIKDFVCCKFSVSLEGADEIALETFDRVCIKVISGEFARQSIFFTYVCGIARNVYREWKFKQVKDRSLVGEEFALEVASDSVQPETFVIDAESRELRQLALAEAIDRLPPVQKAVYQCKHLTCSPKTIPKGKLVPVL